MSGFPLMAETEENKPVSYMTIPCTEETLVNVRKMAYEILFEGIF
jgi:hypothetical protein